MQINPRLAEVLQVVCLAVKYLNCVVAHNLKYELCVPGHVHRAQRSALGSALGAPAGTGWARRTWSCTPSSAML